MLLWISEDVKLSDSVWRLVCRRGGSWHPTLRLLERVFRERNVVGCDVVELAPIPGMVAPDFVAAKLIYKMIGFFAAGA